MRFIKMALIIFGAISFSHASESVRFDARQVPIGFMPVHAYETDFIICLPVSKNQWKIESQTKNGNSKWTSNINLGENEKIFRADLIGDNFLVFSILEDFLKKESILRVRLVNPQNGLILSENEIWKRTISELLWNKDKAQRIAREELEIASIRSGNTEVQADYRFDIRFSKSRTAILVSAIDNSKQYLKQEWRLYDRNMKLMHAGGSEIDNFAKLYDFGVNDDYKVFQLLLGPQDDIQVLRFESDGSKFDMLQVAVGNSVRDDLRLVFAGDEKVFAVCKTEIDGKFYGVLYTVMNFETLEVEKVHFEVLPSELKSTADSLLAIGNSEASNWMNFKLSYAELFNDEELLVVFESFDIRRSGHVFRDVEYEQNLEWKEHKAKITCGPAMIYSFDKQEELRWAKYIHKKSVSSESVIPGYLGMMVQDPQNEILKIGLKDDRRSFLHTMDYIYNLKSENISLKAEGVFVPQWSNMDFLTFYSEQLQKITIQANDN